MKGDRRKYLHILSRFPAEIAIDLGAGLRHQHFMSLMLRLLHPTDPTWAEAAEEDLGGLLMDHAHCEIKAAQNALSLVGRHGGEAPKILEPLTNLAREESRHFDMVVQKIRVRGEKLSLPKADQYVRQLRAAAKKDHDGSSGLCDHLLIGALIEARSCERFKLLSEHFKNEELSEFYRALMESEARHFTLFRDLAEAYFGQKARARLKVLAEREGEIASLLPLGPTMHG